jgi:hypothetical protein
MDPRRGTAGCSAYGALLLSILSINGCAASGPRFAPIDVAPQGAAVIYIYTRPSWFGVAASWLLVANGHPLAIFSGNGIYCVHVTNEKLITYAAVPTTKQKVLADLAVGVGGLAASKEQQMLSDFRPKPGRTYFLRWETSVMTGQKKLVPVDEKQGSHEIAECHRAEPVTESRGAGRTD